MNASEVAKLYETVSSIPGLNENIKLSSQISRRNELLFSRIIESGLAGIDSDKSARFADVFYKNALEILGAFADDCLKKAGLKELNAKLKDLDSK